MSNVFRVLRAYVGGVLFGVFRITRLGRSRWLVSRMRVVVVQMVHRKTAFPITSVLSWNGPQAQKHYTTYGMIAVEGI
jgi:hypothetical protein